MTEINLQDEFNSKKESILEIMNELGLDALLITAQKNFSWLTGGSNYVVIPSTAGECKLLLTREADYLVSNNIEAGRALEEEITGLDLELKVFNWFEPEQEREVIREIAGDTGIGADVADEEYVYVGERLDRLRLVLTEEEIKRYRLLGRESGEVVEQVCFQLKAGESELEIAALVAAEFFRRRIVPVVLNVAVDDRISKYRHPLPTGKRLENHAMISACGRRDGLVTSLTREIYLGRPDTKLRDKHRDTAEIDGCYIGYTRPGSRVADVFNKAVSLYESKGYDREWQLHHQGGPIGYAAREYLATEQNSDLIRENQAFAWNPTITGTKSEDTVIIHKDHNEIITSTGEFPQLEVESGESRLARPDILVRTSRF